MTYNISKNWLKFFKVLFNVIYGLIFCYSVFILFIISIKGTPHKHVDARNSFLTCPGHAPQSLEQLSDANIFHIGDYHWFPDNQDYEDLKQLCGSRDFKLDVKRVDNITWQTYWLRMAGYLTILIVIFVIVKQILNYLVAKLLKRFKPGGAKIPNDSYQVSLKMILKNERGEILLLKALNGGTFANFYDLPGGRINIDEFTVPLVEILKREVVEEVGNINFTITSDKPVAVGRHLYPTPINNDVVDIHILMIFFEAQYLSGDVVISREHSEFQWVDFSKEDPAKLLKSGILEGVKMYLQNR